MDDKRLKHIVGLVGSTGFIGRYVKEELGLEGRIIDIPRIAGDPCVGVDAATDRFIRLNPIGWENLVWQLEGCTCVVNAGGSASPDARDWSGLWSANVLLPAVVLRAASLAGVPRMLHFSSAAVQGLRDPLDETPVVAPLTPYARSKAEAEKELRRLALMYGLELVIYRPASVLGPGRNFARALRALSRLPMIPVADPDAPVPTALVQNVAAAAALLARSERTPAIALHPNEGMTVRTLLEAVCDRKPRLWVTPLGASVVRRMTRAGMPLRLRAIARRAEVVMVGRRQNARALAALGYQPVVGRDGYKRLARTCSDKTSDRFRIAFVITRSDEIGGAAVHVIDIAVALQNAGHEVRVFVGGTGRLTDRLDEEGVSYQSLVRLARPVRPFVDALAVGELATALRQFRPDVVSTHSSKAGLVGRLACQLTRVPALFTAHGWAFTEGVAPGKRRLYALIERCAAPLSSRIVCVSEHDFDLGVRAGIAPRRMKVVHNGVRQVKLSLLADPSIEPPEIVMVARFDKQKDQALLVEALARCSSPWRLRLVGVGPSLEEVRDRAVALGVGGRIVFDGFSSSVAQLLSDAQIFALITNWEGLPRSILEAMRAGLPVLASDVGGVSEIVGRENGRVVSRGNIDELVVALDELLADPQLRLELGARGRELYLEHFTIDRLVDDTLRQYEALLGRELRRPESIPLA